MKKPKYYYSDGTRAHVIEWINNCEWSFPIIVIVMILACGWLGC